MNTIDFYSGALEQTHGNPHSALLGSLSYGAGPTIDFPEWAVPKQITNYICNTLSINQQWQEDREVATNHSK